VSSVILDFRAYDTLGEVVVLFTAIVGVLAVLRGIGRKQKTERPGAE
jgi:multicomponent Na+:H+ antiporter subunit B